MAQVNFNDKSGGDYVQAGEINALKNAINTNEGLVTNGSVSGYFDSNNNFRYNHHIIPESNANFDLGSAEYKVRHLFLSNNSLWMGDDTKISLKDNGEIVSAKIRTGSTPETLFMKAMDSGMNYTDFLIRKQEIMDNKGYTSETELTTQDYLELLRDFIPDATIDDLYPGIESEKYMPSDWEETESITKKRELGYESYFYNESTSGLTFDVDLTKNNKFFINLAGKYTTGTYDNNRHLIEMRCHTDDISRGYDLEFVLHGANQLSEDPNFKFKWIPPNYSIYSTPPNVDQHIESVSGDRSSSDWAIVKCKTLTADVGSFFIVNDTVNKDEPFEVAFDKKGHKFRCGKWGVYGNWVTENGMSSQPRYADIYVQKAENGYVEMFLIPLSGSPDELPNSINAGLINVNLIDDRGFVEEFSFAETKSIAILEIKYLSDYTDVTSSKSW